MTTTEIRSIALKTLVLSDTDAQAERRVRFDKVALAELGKSLTTTGQINPIVVRPVGKAFEIVAGERRYLAAKLAGLGEILCSVRELSDQQVLEVQIIENLQREDLHELAEAEAYEALVKMGRSPAQIAGQVHKDESYVRKRMRLLALCDKGRKAFYEGKITVALAIVLARIPVQKLQEEALAWYLEESAYENVTGQQFREFVQEHFMLELGSAPFDITDPLLVKAAGACAVCPKNTLCQGQLFDDIKGKAYCSDPVCFKTKRETHGLALLAKAKASGRDVITGKEAKKIAARGDATNLVGYFNTAGHAYGKPLKKLLKDVDPKVLKLLQIPETGEVIEVAPASVVHKLKPAETTRKDPVGDRYRAQQRAAELARELELASRKAIFQAIHATKLEAVDQGGTLRDGVLQFWSCIGADTKQLVAKALGWDLKGKTQSTGMSMARHFDLEPFLPADQAGLWKMLRALSLAGDLSFYQHGGSSTPKRLNAAAAALKIDVKKVRAEVVTARKEKAKPKAKKKAGKK